MVENYKLARPYAEAVAHLAAASGKQSLEQWSNALEALSAIVSDESVAALLGNPRVSRRALADAIISIGADDFDDSAANLIRMLAEGRRLRVAPAISVLYEQEKERLENRTHVEVTSAQPLSNERQEKLRQALESRLSCQVSMTFKQDESALGGVIIRAGDWVIDGSVKGKMERMRQTLAQ